MNPTPQSTAENLSHYPELAEHAIGWRHGFASNALSGKVILITGAGDGLGAATAKTYASFGATVILLGKTREKLEAVNDWISQNTSTQPVIVPCDLETLNLETATNLADSISNAFGTLDGIVHHASRLGPRAPLAHYPNDEWQKVMQINVNAVFLLNHALFSLLDTSNRACVIHTSSSVGREGRAYWGAYAASKFAIEGMAQVWAAENEGLNSVRINCINPGATSTQMRATAFPAENQESIASPTDIMPAYLYLMGPDSKGINGQSIDAQVK